MAEPLVDLDVAIGILRARFQQCIGFESGRLEITAAWKDALALTAAAPSGVKDVLAPCATYLPSPSLIEIIAALKLLLQRDVIPPLKCAARTSALIVSPYAGGVVLNSNGDFPRSAANDSLQRKTLTVGTFNPGRTGFLGLGTHELLSWRIWAVADAMQREGIDICVLPGARFPSGAFLPHGFPFSWWGIRTSSWAGVGLFCCSDLEHAIREVPDLGADRIMWIEVWSDEPNSVQPALVLGCIYAAPGGDLLTWDQAIKEFIELCRRYPDAQVLLAGDGNLHLSYCQDHEQPCRCPHCMQTRNDRSIENALQASGLVAFNPPVPTHSSGTCLDLIMGRPSKPLKVTVVPDRIGLSDHLLVKATVEISMLARPEACLGRVAWATKGNWEEGLLAVRPLLFHLGEAVESLLAIPELRPPWLGGSISTRQRRACLDAAAWARDALYTLIGHSSQAVRAVQAASPTSRRGPLVPSSVAGLPHQLYKTAVEQATWDANNRIVRRYLQLRAKDPGAAEKFLSHLFRAEANFTIALADPVTGRALTSYEMVEALVDDVQERARAEVPHDPVLQTHLRKLVETIRHAGAAENALGSSDHANGPALPCQPVQLYSPQEVDEALDKLKPGSSCIKGCFAAPCVHKSQSHAGSPGH